MVLEGCLRRKNASASQMIMKKDAILWGCIAQMSPPKHRSTWDWIIYHVDKGKNVQYVLNHAGTVWCEY